jgi:hypothetical protein
MIGQTKPIISQTKFLSYSLRKEYKKEKTNGPYDASKQSDDVSF